MRKGIIDSLSELKELCTDRTISISILLNSRLRNSRQIAYFPDDKVFSVLNKLTDTIEDLTEKDIMKTNIGRAITRKALVFNL